MILHYKDLDIEIINDPEYTIQSNNNTRRYANLYSTISDYEFSSKQGIIVSRNNEKLNSAIVLGNGGGTGVHEKSTIIKDDSIFVCCGNSIFSLHLPDLSLNWLKKIDDATCFGIHEFENDFIIHGEMEISRITKNGEVVWKFSGRDVFVNLEGKKEFEIINGKINLIDFLNYRYVLDGNGREIN